jgi:hypothetical protein
LTGELFLNVIENVSLLSGFVREFEREEAEKKKSQAPSTAQTDASKPQSAKDDRNEST